MRLCLRLPLLAVALLLVALVSSGPAGAGTVIGNPSIVFDGTEREHALSLHNQSDRAITYRIATSPLVRQPDGSFAEPADPARLGEGEDTSQFIRFRPRQVTVPPGGYQTIKLALRKPADLPPGEYRLALTITELSDQAELDRMAAQGNLVVGVQLAHRLTIRIHHR